MPARNTDHDVVVEALVADEWTITHDPLTLKFEERRIHIDLAAERSLVGAERGSERIAVEIRTFALSSEIKDVEDAVGQFIVYRTILGRMEPDRRLYVAVNDETYNGIFSEAFGRTIVDSCQMPIIVFKPEDRRSLQWIKSNLTEK